MANEGTLKQIQDWLEEAVRKATKPTPQEEAQRKLKISRRKRLIQTSKNYGL